MSDKSLEQVAREIVAQPARLSDSKLDRDIRSEADIYLSFLADGYDEPDELLRLLAKADAAEDFQGIAFDYERRTGRGHYGDFGDWFDGREDEYLAATRSTYGMGEKA